MNVNYYMGITRLSLRTTDLAPRVDALKFSLSHLACFMRSVSDYGLVTEEMAAMTSTRLSRRDVNIARDKMVKRFTRQIEETDGLLESEESQREMALCVVRMNWLKATRELELIQEELAHIDRRIDSQMAEGENRVPAAKSHPDPTTKVTRPFTIVQSRDQLSKDVFRPGHNLPTMTIDEYLELERKKGRIIERGQGKGKKDSHDEDDEMTIERQRQKDILSDLYKDESRRGSGNTYNIS